MEVVKVLWEVCKIIFGIGIGIMALYISTWNLTDYHRNRGGLTAKTKEYILKALPYYSLIIYSINIFTEQWNNFINLF